MQGDADEHRRIFISYSRKDSDFTPKLAQDLRERDVAIWMDKLDIPTGANWDEAVEQALRSTERQATYDACRASEG